jgi:plastocyanin
MRARGKLTAGITAVAVLVPATALADERIDAAPSNRYSTPQIEIDQGERVIFRNGDVASHDVTADQKGADGKPIFASPLIDRNEEAEVKGADSLATGSYGFFCSVHPQMKGTIKVNTNGTPKPRGGATGGGGGATGGPGDTADTQAPTVAVRVLSSAIRSTRSAGVLRVSVGVDEASAVTLKAVARPKVGGPLVTIATGKVTFDGAGRRNVEALLTRAGRRALRNRKRLAVIVTAKAVDRAGNAGEEAHGRTLGFKQRKRR